MPLWTCPGCGKQIRTGREGLVLAHLEAEVLRQKADELYWQRSYWKLVRFAGLAVWVVVIGVTLLLWRMW
jgi:hypothetical protein